MATKIKREHKALYDTDFFRWTEEQAAALRAGRLEDLDLSNLAEEIESLGRSDRREIESRLGVLLMHLLKWRYQPQKRSGSWETTIRTQRREIEKLLNDSPSLRREVGAFTQGAYDSSRRNAAAETGMPLEAFPAACPFRVEDVMTDEWLP